MAERQTAGRGRQGRKWESADGNFAGSTLVVLRAGDPSPASLSLAAGLALLEALEVAAPGGDYLLKWPNDLMLDGGKLAGILLERSGDRVVAGMGVNLAQAPVIAGRKTASLGGKVLPTAFAPLLAASFARLLGAWRTADAEAFARAWEQRAHPRGTRLTIHDDSGATVSGRFDGIEADGAMRLLTDDGRPMLVRAGDVSLG